MNDIEYRRNAAEAKWARDYEDSRIVQIIPADGWWAAYNDRGRAVVSRLVGWGLTAGGWVVHLDADSTGHVESEPSSVAVFWEPDPDKADAYAKRVVAEAVARGKAKAAAS